MIDLAATPAPAAGQVVTGVLGFLVVAAMGVALFFLLRSMNKHLRRVVREPVWREEAQRDDAQREEAPAGQDEQDFSHNGTPQG